MCNWVQEALRGKIPASVHLCLPSTIKVKYFQRFELRGTARRPVVVIFVFTFVCIPLYFLLTTYPPSGCPVLDGFNRWTRSDPFHFVVDAY